MIVTWEFILRYNLTELVVGHMPDIQMGCFPPVVRSFPIRLVGEDHLLAELSGHSFHPQATAKAVPSRRLRLSPADPSTLW